MKITAIVGSARDNGSTAKLVHSLLDGAASVGTETACYYISKVKMNYCLGCKKCYVDGKCCQNDDVQEIVRDILTSDYVVIASPSYWGDVPGQLKTFFDRNTPFGDTNPNRILIAEKKIRGVGIAVRAGKTEWENTVILDFIDHYFGHLGIEPMKRFSVCETDSPADLMQKHSDIIHLLFDYGVEISQI